MVRENGQGSPSLQLWLYPRSGAIWRTQLFKAVVRGCVDGDALSFTFDMNTLSIRSANWKFFDMSLCKFQTARFKAEADGENVIGWNDVIWVV